MHSLSLDSSRAASSRPSPRTCVQAKLFGRLKSTSPRAHSNQEPLADVQTLRMRVAELEKLLDWERKRGQQLMAQLVQQSQAMDEKDAAHLRELENVRKEISHRRVLSDLSPEEHAARRMDPVSTLHEQVQSKLITFNQKAATAVEEQCKGIQKHIESTLQRRLREKDQQLQRMQEEVLRAQDSEALAKKQFEECKDQWVHSESSRYKLLKRNRELEEIKVENDRVIHDFQRHVVELKAECGKLTQELANTAVDEYAPSPQRSPSPQRAQTHAESSKPRSDYVISKLKRMLETERRNVRTAKAALAFEIKTKTDLESFLRDCLADLRLVIGKYRRNAGLSEMERSEILSALMSQAQVLRLLYDRTFPPKGSTNFCRMPDLHGSVDLDSSAPMHPLEEL